MEREVRRHGDATWTRGDRPAIGPRPTRLIHATGLSPEQEEQLLPSCVSIARDGTGSTLQVNDPDWDGVMLVLQEWGIKGHHEFHRDWHAWRCLRLEEDGHFIAQDLKERGVPPCKIANAVDRVVADRRRVLDRSLQCIETVDHSALVTLRLSLIAETDQANARFLTLMGGLLLPGRYHLG